MLPFETRRLAVHGQKAHYWQPFLCARGEKGQQLVNGTPTSRLGRMAETSVMPNALDSRPVSEASMAVLGIVGPCRMTRECCDGWEGIRSSVWRARDS